MGNCLANTGGGRRGGEGGVMILMRNTAAITQVIMRTFLPGKIEQGNEECNTESVFKYMYCTYLFF